MDDVNDALPCRKFFPVMLTDSVLVCDLIGNSIRNIKTFTDLEIAHDFIDEQNRLDVGFEGMTPFFFTKPITIRFEGDDFVV